MPKVFSSRLGLEFIHPIVDIVIAIVILTELLALWAVSGPCNGSVVMLSTRLFTKFIQLGHDIVNSS